MVKTEGWPQSDTVSIAKDKMATGRFPVGGISTSSSFQSVAAEASFGVEGPPAARPTVSSWTVRTPSDDAVIAAPVPSGDMSAVAQLGTILAALKREGALLDYELGGTRGQTIHAFGQVPREELDAYLVVHRRVREGMRDQEFEVDLELDTDAVNS